MKKLKLRTPDIPWNRAKRAVGIVLLAAAMEYVDPLPFLKSFPAILLYIWLTFEVVRQIIRWRLENKYSTVARAERYKAKWERQKDKYDPLARYRFRRFLITIAGLLVYGQIINLFSERCDNPPSCALLSLTLVTESIPMVFQVVIGVAFGMLQFAAMFWYLSGVGFAKVISPGTIDVTFDDIYGQDKPRNYVEQQVALLENTDVIEKAGGFMPKGVLLTGPPGTGKTMLAKAAANKSTKPLLLVPPGAFASTFIGINFIKVLRLGRMIRRFSRRYGGIIVFIDEIDSLGSRGEGVEGGEATPLEPWWNDTNPFGACCAVSQPRNIVVTGGNSMDQGTLTAFLAMMDGMEQPRGLTNKVLSIIGFKPLPPPKVKVFYLGATNRPSALDPALKRAGRFGREIRVDYPKYEGRLATYNGYLAKVKHDLSEDEVEWLARNHHRGTGAEIQDVINEALLIAFRNNTDKPSIMYDDMLKATIWKRFGESHGTFENEQAVWSVAVHEAGHALLMHKNRERSRIWFASIEQRGKTGGMVVPSPLDDDWHQTRTEMINDVAISLASRVAEQIMLGDTSNGHGGDGPHATQIAEKMVANGHTFSMEYIGANEDGEEQYRVRGQLSYSNDRDPEQFHFLREDILREAYLVAEEYLTEHKDALEALSVALRDKHTVMGEDIHRLLEDMGA